MSKWCLLNHRIIHNYDQSYEDHQEELRNYLNPIIDQHDPAGFLIVSGGEADIQCIYGAAIRHLEPWCRKTGRKIHVFASCNQYEYDYPKYVETHLCQAYDVTNYHTCLTAHTPHAEQYLPIDDNYSPDLLFTCYNNRPSEYRDCMINQLFGRGLQNLGIITYRHMTVDMPNMSWWNVEDWAPINNVPYLMPLEDPLEDQFVLNTKPKWVPNRVGPSYLRGVIDIVTESRIDKDEFYLSEKTNKPLFAHKPFLVLGAQGYHKWLKEERQIELYDELFDYSFDDKPSYVERVDGILDNLGRLSTIYKSPEDYKQLWNSVKKKTQRNYFKYMADMRSGAHVESVMHFLGINSDNPDEYKLEKFEKCLTPDYKEHTGNDLFQVADFFRQIVIPHRYGDIERGYIGDDLWENYNKGFPSSPQLKSLWETQ